MFDTFPSEKETESGLGGGESRCENHASWLGKGRDGTLGPHESGIPVA